MPYQGRQPGVGVRNRFIFTATSGQTSFSGADSNGLTLKYADATYTDVFLNGVLLPPTDYTATTKTSVVLGSGAAVNDILEVVAYDISSIADTVSASSGGTFAADVTFAGDAIFGDSDKAIFGAGSDLQIYHDGSNSYVDDAGTGRLILRGNDRVMIQKYTGEDMISCLADGAVNIYHNNAKKFETTSTGVAVTGVVTANAGVVVDNITIDGQEIDVSSGDLTLDVAGDIFLDAGGDNIKFLYGGTAYLDFYKSGSSIGLYQAVQDGDFLFQGNDGGASITALKLDMSEAGAATFNGNATVSGGTLKIVDTELSEVSDNFSINIQSGNNDFLVKSGGNTFASFKGFDGSKNFGAFSNGGGGFNLFVGSANTGSFALRLDGVGTSASNVVQFSNGNGQVGTITLSGTSTAYNTSSDYRLKENVNYDWDATTRLKQLKPARFNFIVDADTTVDGFLAHEAQAVVPEAVTGAKDAMRDEEYVVTAAVEEVTDADGNVTTEAADAVMRTRSVPDIQSIDQSKLVPLLVKTILELEARITALEA